MLLIFSYLKVCLKCLGSNPWMNTMNVISFIQRSRSWLIIEMRICKKYLVLSIHALAPKEIFGFLIRNHLIVIYSHHKWWDVIIFKILWPIFIYHTSNFGNISKIYLDIFNKLMDLMHLIKLRPFGLMRTLFRWTIHKEYIPKSNRIRS